MLANRVAKITESIQVGGNPQHDACKFQIYLPTPGRLMTYTLQLVSATGGLQALSPSMLRQEL